MKFILSVLISILITVNSIVNSDAADHNKFKSVNLLKSEPICVKEGFIRLPTDCETFYKCTYNSKLGFERTEYKCLDGKWFDLTLNTCNQRSRVKDCKDNLINSLKHNEASQSDKKNKTGFDKCMLTKHYSKHLPTKPNANHINTHVTPVIKPSKAPHIKPENTIGNHPIHLHGNIQSHEISKKITKKPSTHDETTSHKKNDKPTELPKTSSKHEASQAHQKIDNKKHDHSQQSETKVKPENKNDNSKNKGITNKHDNSAIKVTTTKLPKSTSLPTNKKHTATEPPNNHHGQKSSGSISPSSNTLPVCTKVGYMTLQGNCSTFYQCTSNGDGGFTQYKFNCADGLWFDSAIGACNYPSEVTDCSNKQQSAIPAKDTTCSKAGFFRMPTNCGVYFECVSNGADGFIKYPFNCPNGLWFDTKLDICNWPNKVTGCDDQITN